MKKLFFSIPILLFLFLGMTGCNPIGDKTASFTIIYGATAILSFLLLKISLSKQSRSDANNSMCEMICEYMKRNIYQTLSLKELCRIFSIGKTQLCKIFQEWLGKSPMEYYSNLKIDAAKKHLREKNYSVSEISDMLGYSSIHNFSRAFKKAVGMSPTAYTKSIL